MRKYLSIRKAFGLGLLVVSAAFGLDTSKLKPTGYVNDFAHALDAASKAHLENYCGNLERATGVQMAIVLVDTLDDEPIDQVANRLYREWGIGKKGKDEGILLMLAVKDHKQRAEIGYGLEPNPDFRPLLVILHQHQQIPSSPLPMPAPVQPVGDLVNRLILHHTMSMNTGISAARSKFHDDTQMSLRPRGACAKWHLQ